jgi:diguanylate cyclase (GGDEF)-like protein
MYDFSLTLNNTNNKLFNEFTDRYTACINSYDDEKFDTVMAYYKNIFEILGKPFHLGSLIDSFEALAKYKMSISIPYVIITNEIYGLKNLLISKMTDENASIIDLFKLFGIINNHVAKIYLHDYIERLVSLNHIRINSLSDLVEKNIISHYESHLIWLTGLAEHIRDENKDDFVELNHELCEFGIWLKGDAKKVIFNNSKYKSIDNLHKSLHLFAKKIFTQVATFEYHILITYLEKCELISLSLGTELALVDNILMNKRITKDTLTGALNRHALKNVFESQYELSLATNSSFVLAMCDLDFFKDVNDTHGHIAGDKLLKSFVETVKRNIRSSDVIVRYGGEEFVIMLPSINKKKGLEVLENIRLDFQKNFLHFNSQKVNTTVSIGMMEIHPDKEYKKSFVDEYIMIADQKLYMAKASGRNRIEVC